MRSGTVTCNALVILNASGPMCAADLGGTLWAHKIRGRTSSSGGGGDYAAQMLLGRLRKLGLAKTVRGDGASLWTITADGRWALNEATAAAGRRELIGRA